MIQKKIRPVTISSDDQSHLFFVYVYLELSRTCIQYVEVHLRAFKHGHLLIGLYVIKEDEYSMSIHALVFILKFPISTTE